MIQKVELCEDSMSPPKDIDDSMLASIFPRKEAFISDVSPSYDYLVGISGCM